MCVCVSKEWINDDDIPGGCVIVYQQLGGQLFWVYDND